MSTYYIGDVQGCFDELQQLLQLIHFNPQQDTLGFVGDIVNRGPNSLETLRFISTLPRAHVVLGNHDLYLLAVGYNAVPKDRYKHTLHDVLNAPDKNELLGWLRHQPLVYVNSLNPSVMVHAGIPPQWSIDEILLRAKEVHNTLRGRHFVNFLIHLFGDTPEKWNDQLMGQDRLRYITNALTRMRFCTHNGTLEFSMSSKNSTRADYQPWFTWRNNKTELPIYFGHWAALGGECDHENIFALDTGCVWGHELTAIRLEDQQRFSVKKA